MRTILVVISVVISVQLIGLNELIDINITLDSETILLYFPVIDNKYCLESIYEGFNINFSASSLASDY
jgi:hypothetical protein